MFKMRKLGMLILVITLLIGPTSAQVLAADGTPPANPAREPSVLQPSVITRNTPVTIDGDTSVYTVSPEAQRATEDFWTYERRAAAQPLAMPEISQAQIAEAAAQPADVGEFGSTSSGLPAPEANKIARAEFADEWSRIEQDQIAEAMEAIRAFEAGEFLAPEGIAGAKGIYTSFRTNYFSEMWKEFPYRAVGKLYFQGPEGPATCSAAVIGSNNILVTAGHCVHGRKNKDDWFSGWTFVPADRNGSAPYGTWTADHARALNAYINSPTSSLTVRYDVALIKLKKRYINSAWRPVSYTTGYLGRAYNNTYRQLLFAQGYPSNLDSGKYSWTCVAESFWHAPDVLGMGCNMMHGSSGGPWILRFYPYMGGAVNLVNSVVSGVPAGVPVGSNFYGPRFSKQNIVILCNAEKC